MRLITRTGYVITNIADPNRREQLISQLQAELTLAARKLSDTDREFRLARERQERELEAARAEAWELRVLATDLRQQLEAVRQERSEHDALSNHDSATADDDCTP